MLAVIEFAPDPELRNSMTYCVALKFDAGLVFASDTRTNAGVDNISRVDKMHVFANAGDRVIVALSAGNLSITQNALNQIERAAKENPGAPNIYTVSSLYDAAELIGNTLREVRNRDGEYLRAQHIDASASFFVGGQIALEDPRLFLVYSEGNFIEASGEAPFFQVGEIKYGKPVIDRVLRKDLPIPDAIKLTLVSMDSTMRSNISVGLPIDVLVYPVNSLNANERHRIEEDDDYFRDLGKRWNDGLKQAFASVLAPQWGFVSVPMQNSTAPVVSDQNSPVPNFAPPPLPVS